MHAGWNLLLARSRDPQAATAFALVVGVVCFAPVAALDWEVRPEVVPFLVATWILELLYFGLLATAYRRSELSVFYPIARGLAPVVVLIIGVVILGTGTNAGELTGVALVAIGVLLVRGLRGGDTTGLLLGLAIALVIGTYTLVDREGVRYASPAAYVELALLVPALVYLGAVLARRGWGVVRAEAGAHTVLAGLALFAAYGLALSALRLAPPASVAAVRESSVVMATVLGFVVLHERVGPARLLGSLSVLAGVCVLALA